MADPLRRGLIEDATGDLLCWGYSVFVPGAGQTERTDIPEAAKTRAQALQGIYPDHHRWNGSAWVLVAVTALVPLFPSSDGYPGKKTTASETWERVALLFYPGTDYSPAPAKVIALAGIDDASEATLRVRDIKNNQVICAATVTTDAYPEVVTLAAPANLPTGYGILALQIKRTGGSGAQTVTGKSFHLLY